ncbi:MAG: hypothetical protein IKI57_05590 [Clostridia bacterium]|nr:hypothetical protein [Clostridia bacterium]
MKKISLLMAVLLLVMSAFSTVFASGDFESDTSVKVEDKVETKKEEIKVTSSEEIQEDKISDASKKTQKNLVSKEEKIRQNTEKLGGNRTNGTVLYYLELVRSYSYPVCFIGLVIASLNFFIIGNKKLEKREQGFKMLVTIIVGLIVFQVLPLLFAIIVAER